MKKYVLITIGIATLLFAVVFLPSLLVQKNLTSELARALGTNAKVINLNLPPSPLRLPGTIIAPYKDRVLTYGGPFRDDNRIISGDEFNVSGVLSDTIALAGSLSSSILREALRNREDVVISVNITDGRILEMRIPDLKEVVAAQKYATQKRNVREKQLVINKAYEGIVEYIISKKSEKNADFYTKLKNKAEASAKRNVTVKYSAVSEGDQSFHFSIKKPIIIAYECLNITDLNDTLSGEETSIEFQEVTSEQVLQAGYENQPRLSPSSKSPKRIGLISIASGHFDHLATMDIPQVVSSAKEVQKILSQFHPVYEKHLYSTPKEVLTDTKILEWSIDRTLELIDKKLDFLIVYYAGHGFQRGDGELLLPQGNLRKNFAEAALESISIPNDHDGYLTAQTLFNAFGTSGTPYVVLIDACFPSEEMQQALNRVYMTLFSKSDGNLLYHGPNALITNEMSEIAKTLREIGSRFPYRTDNNVLIFSAKPGVLAQLVDDPFDVTGEKMAPLAAKFITNYQSTFPQRDLSLSDLLLSIIDTKGSLGEVTLVGSISWSDLSTMKAQIGDIFQVHSEQTMAEQ